MTRSPFYNPAQTNPGQNYTTEMNKVWSPSNTSGTYPSLTATCGRRYGLGRRG